MKDGDDTMNPSTALAQALQRYMDARSAAMLKARRTLKVNEMDARALLYIADSPGTRPSNLRDYLGITSAGVTTLVDRLAERGAVRREVDAADRRVNRLTVTVDLASAPWSALRMFDDAFSAAAIAANPLESSRLAAALDALTSSAADAMA
jgi:DNA-binding MarR family transcriptional regulator